MASEFLSTYAARAGPIPRWHRNISKARLGVDPLYLILFSVSACSPLSMRRMESQVKSSQDRETMHQYGLQGRLSSHKTSPNNVMGGNPASSQCFALVQALPSSQCFGSHPQQALSDAQSKNCQGIYSPVHGILPSGRIRNPTDLCFGPGPDYSSLSTSETSNTGILEPFGGRIIRLSDAIYHHLRLSLQA